MNRLNYPENATFIDINKCHNDYKEYLFSIKDKLPESVFNFAVADWHYNPEDHKCLHDSQLESLEILEKELFVSEKRTETNIEIKISLLGAYQNARIQLLYRDVKYYFLEKTPLVGTIAKVIKKPTTYHGDWIIDEIYLSKEELVVHEIELAFGAKWIIHCQDIEYNWTPLESRNH